MKARLAVAACLLWSGASAVLAQTTLPENQERFRALVIERAPVGSDIDKAKTAVEGPGLRCIWVENRAFPGLARPADHFYCLSQTAGPKAKQWQAALVPQARKVTEVRATFGLVGE